MQRKPASRTGGITLRHRNDHVGSPCTNTTGAPSPSSTWAKRIPSTSRWCAAKGKSGRSCSVSSAVRTASTISPGSISGVSSARLAAVHTLAIHLAPVLAAEKSKTAYYIAGGLLVAWALIVSVLLGLRKPDFPGNAGGQRVVMAITAVLVIAAASTAVITSGSPAKGEEASVASQSAAKQSSEAAKKPATLSPGSSPVKQGESSGPTGTGPTSGKPPAGKAPVGKARAGKSPKATTGTPAPPSSPAAATTTLKLAANPAGQLSYDTKQLSAKAGKVTIEMTNTSPVEHDVAVAQGATVAGQTPVFTGGSKSVTLTLKPGTYSFYCTVPGHRQAGMEGTLKVS